MLKTNITWISSKKGLFTVKSFYRKLTKEKLPSHWPLKQMLRSNVPFQVVFFTWIEACENIQKEVLSYAASESICVNYGEELTSCMVRIIQLLKLVSLLDA